MKQIRFLLVGAAALTLWGCGGGGGTAGPPSGNSLANGRAALNSMASGSQPTSSQSLQSALTLFQQATQQDPNNTEAQWGSAVCLAGLVAQEVDGAQTTVSQTVSSQPTASKAAAKPHTRSDPNYPPPPPPP
ncbi:MAG TPA: tetratricopeptide repeat protein, partial [Chthonomonadaceae bacterium]|nr:tetratricopeptide repeat protein [Chthonomonadaceae bacterium]